MNRYGQSTITWGTAAAPHIFKGVCTNYSYSDALTRQLDEDEVGDNRALILHSRKANISFDAKVIVGEDDGSADFLDLSTGAAVTVTGINAGVVLASRAVERWTLLQPKTISMQGTHYPDITQAAPVAAGALDAQTPDQSAIVAPLILPGGKLIYSTIGLTSTGGVVHMVEISQSLTLTEDDPTPDGKIPGCAAHGYVRTISMDLLIKTTDTAPVPGALLNLTASSAMSNIADYRVETAETRFTEKRGKMINVTAVWIPGMTVVEG